MRKTQYWIKKKIYIDQCLWGRRSG